MELIEHLKSRLEAHFGPRYDQDRFVLAVSGGIDSMVLAECVVRLFPPDQLLVAHFDHGVRKNSSSDAAFVKAFAKQKAISFVTATRQSSNIDEAALRKERFAFLETQRAHFSATAIVLAHHVEDQLETFLMRLTRGTGIKGLSGMSEWQSQRFRPLLGVSRETIEAFARKQKVAFVEDETNAQPLYFRNRVRAELVPVLRKLAQEFGSESAFETRFVGLIEEIQTTQTHLETLSNQLFRKWTTESAYWIRVSQKELSQLLPLEQNLLLRRIVERLGVDALDRNRFKRLSSEALNPGLKQFDQKGALSILHSFGQLYFQTATQRTMGPPKFDVVDHLAQNAMLGFSGSVEPGLHWRTFQPGDRWESRKLKECFQRWRIPRPERGLLPLLVDKKDGRLRWHPYAEEPSKHLKTLSFPFARPIAQ